MGEVCCHPFIIGELACGNIKNREEIILLLRALPQGLMAEQDEVLQFVEQHALYGKGLGFIDIHLLASCLLSDILLWTKDKKLRGMAKQFDVCFS